MEGPEHRSCTELDENPAAEEHKLRDAIANQRVKMDTGRQLIANSAWLHEWGWASLRASCSMLVKGRVTGRCAEGDVTA